MMVSESTDHRLRNRPEKIKSRISDKPVILHFFLIKNIRAVHHYVITCGVKKRNILTSLTSRHFI